MTYLQRKALESLGGEMAWQEDAPDFRIVKMGASFDKMVPVYLLQTLAKPGLGKVA
jgi:hypothetical protein